MLFLTGEFPSNDIKVLVELGVNPFFIEGIEKDGQIWEKAIEDLKTNGYAAVRIHHTSLLQFLQERHEQFHIIYYDATCHFPASGFTQEPVSTLYEIFLQNALASRSALITNFATPKLQELKKSGFLPLWYQHIPTEWKGFSDQMRVGKYSTMVTNNITNCSPFFSTIWVFFFHVICLI